MLEMCDVEVMGVKWSASCFCKHLLIYFIFIKPHFKANHIQNHCPITLWYSKSCSLDFGSEASLYFPFTRCMMSWWSMVYWTISDHVKSQSHYTIYFKELRLIILLQEINEWIIYDLMHLTFHHKQLWVNFFRIEQVRWTLNYLFRIFVWTPEGSETTF